jgi:hypothetical protein
VQSMERVKVGSEFKFRGFPFRFVVEMSRFQFNWSFKYSEVLPEAESHPCKEQVSNEQSQCCSFSRQCTASERPRLILLVDPKGFWRWCIILRITGFLDPVIEISSF